MQDLNDLYYFAKVVESGGFAAAGRLLGIPKSRLSRRIAELEERLGAPAATNHSPAETDRRGRTLPATLSGHAAGSRNGR
jgi:DNA-binding transcriptional LysR family regulator